MTTQEKLLEVENSIRKAIPRLLDLSMGCKLWKEGYFYTYMGKLIPEIDFRYTDPYYLHHFYSEEIVKNKKETFLYTIGDKKFKHYKIIGHEISLSDVLEWFDKIHFKPEESITMFDEIISEQGITSILSLWDFSKKYLPEQSDFLINFLYKILKNNSK